ncbi:MAG TPA: sensor histidine kinase [Jatrophihabitans sp.]|nr:sensor histidine kinase [Jatrophihabitans sp.]
MFTVDRLPRSPLDWLIAIIGLALCEVATWVQPNPISTFVAGPAWMLGVYPVLLAAPLAWRRAAPIAAFTVIMTGVVLQAVVTSDTPEGIHLMYAAGFGIYAAAAYSDRRPAVLGLVIGVAAFGVYSAENRDVRTGKASELWAAAFFGVALVAVWLIGVFVRNRREEAGARLRAIELEREAATAVADERARLARELHDVVAHSLSVVVLQAAGARAAGVVDPTTLEKIERTGRESLVEMRRLLGVLRRADDEPGLEPQPGISRIDELADRVRAAGVPVDVRIDGDRAALPPALDASVYRIIQESLTNVLKHAGRAHATVSVRVDTSAVTIDVIDDGSGPAQDSEGGHGLIGMRERVALFDGELSAGPRPGGGFAVHARLARDNGRPR